MASEVSALALPGEILLQCILIPFCSPEDLARVLAASRDLRSLRQACVASVLAKLFEGPGAANGISWIRLRHADKLDDIGLIDWLCRIKDTAASGAYRTSPGENHTVGMPAVVSRPQSCFEAVITPGGRALAAGSGRNGALGEITNMNSFLFTEVDLRWGGFPGRIPVAAVACGHQHTLFLTAAGTVHSCGLGDYGRLGHGDGLTLSRPALIESLVDERITQIAAGAAHSVAVSWKGEAFTWGWGFMGALGHGNEIDCLRPVRVSIPDYVVSPDTPPRGAAGALRSAYSTPGAGVDTTIAAGTSGGSQSTLGADVDTPGAAVTPGSTQSTPDDDFDTHGAAGTPGSTQCTPGADVDTPGAAGTPGSTRSTPGADVDTPGSSTQSTPGDDFDTPGAARTPGSTQSTPGVVDTHGTAGTLHRIQSTPGADVVTHGAAGAVRSTHPTPGADADTPGAAGTPGRKHSTHSVVDTHGAARSTQSTPDVVDTHGAACKSGSAQSTPGADGSTGSVAELVKIHRITCAAATLNRTVVGTSSGRVLMSALLGVSSAFTGVGFFEIGRLPDGLRCRRVEISQYVSLLSRSVFVIDSAGHIHVFPEDGANPKPSFVSSHANDWWRYFGNDVSMGGGGASMGNYSVGMDNSGGNRSGIVDGGQACGQEEGLHPDLALDPGLAASSRSPMSLVKCSSVFISPGEAAEGVLNNSFFPDGMEGLGPFSVVVVVSDDGCLMTAPTKSNGVHELRRRRSDSVVCAAIGVVAREPYGLLMVDGGASLLTWGHVTAGQLGHGHSHQVRTPTVVTSAFILGSTIFLKNRRSRSSNVRISLANDRQRVRPSVASDVGGNAARKRPCKEACLLALVDAAADERDAKEDPLPVRETKSDVAG